MTTASDRLGKHLAASEPLEVVGSATFLDDSTRESVAVGMTDRRILCISQAGSFVDIGYDHICSIRSRERTTTTYRGMDYRLPLVSGGLLALLAFVGVFALAPRGLVPALTLVTLGGVASVEYVRRNGVEIDWNGLIEYVDEATDSSHVTDDIRRHKARINERADDDQLLIGAGGLLAALAFVGVLALAPGVLVPALTLVTVGGVALIDYAYRHREEFDGIEEVRQHQRDVRIDTDSGHTIHLRIDPHEGIDHELSRLTYGSEPDAPSLTSSPS